MEERPAADSVVVDTPDHAGVHALVRRSTRSDAVPLLPVHGWPSTPADFLDLLGPAHRAAPRRPPGVRPLPRTRVRRSISTSGRSRDGGTALRY
ncbi:MAG: epoxide hydrolase N-terminal domain-containing protein [Actinomycetota bacterium]